MDTVQMRSRDFLIPGYPGTRISRRYPYFRPQLPITSHLLSIYYIQHAKICDGLTTFNALLSDRKQKNKMPTVSSFFARVFLTTYYFLLRISSLPNLRTPAQKKQEKRRKKPPTRQQLLLQNVHLSSVVFDGFFSFCYYYRQWLKCLLLIEKTTKISMNRKKQKTKLQKTQIELNVYFFQWQIFSDNQKTFDKGTI